MSSELAGRVAVVTGAVAGIGLARLADPAKKTILKSRNAKVQLGDKLAWQIMKTTI